MSTAIERQLSAHLARLADRAPSSEVTTAGVRVTMAVRRRRRRAVRSGIAVALAVTGAVAVLALTRHVEDGSITPVAATTTTTAEATTTTLDPAGPVAVTGIRIGETNLADPPVPGLGPDGSVDLDQIPEWIAVGDPSHPELGCIGYVRKDDLWRPDATPDNITDPVVIYDENEQPIGQIANGVTTVFDT